MTTDDSNPAKDNPHQTTMPLNDQNTPAAAAVNLKNLPDAAALGIPPGAARNEVFRQVRGWAERNGLRSQEWIAVLNSVIASRSELQLPANPEARRQGEAESKPEEPSRAESESTENVPESKTKQPPSAVKPEDDTHLFPRPAEPVPDVQRPAPEDEQGLLIAPPEQMQLPLPPDRDAAKPVWLRGNMGGTTCLWPVKSQEGGWKVQIEGAEVFVGDPQAVPGDKRKNKSWSIKHGIAFAVLMGMTEKNERPDGAIVFRMNDFLERFHGRPIIGGRDMIKAENLFMDFRDTWVSYRFPNGDTGRFAVIDSLGFITTRCGKSAKRQKYCTLRFAPGFNAFAEQIKKSVPIRLDLIAAMSSDLAQTIAYYVGSRAVYHSPEAPWSISAPKLLKQSGARVPKKKVHQKEMFTRRRAEKGSKSVKDYLNGFRLSDGRRMGMDIVDNADKSGYNVLFWAEEDAVYWAGVLSAKGDDRDARELKRALKGSGLKEDQLKRWIVAGKDSKCREAWVRGKGDPRVYEGLIAHQRKLKAEGKWRYDYTHDREMCRIGKVDFDRISKLLDKALALVGRGKPSEVFSGIKGETVESSSPGNPTGAAVFRLLERIERAAKKRSDGYKQAEKADIEERYRKLGRHR